MFQKIVVAYNESPEAKRALVSSVELAKRLSAQLNIVTVMADLPAYTAYAAVADPSLPNTLREDRRNFYRALQQNAVAVAEEQSIPANSYLLEGHQVESLVHFLREQKSDLLVVGLHQRDLYIARLWSTVYELAQEAPCSVLGVH
ncbi:universal stress protein [Granulicella sp. S190]|uniref:universal stress protein n=1 Tax=Granulicella sp. S190 TaxID=1747226 RepID=UPI00131BB00F|nr:universal stress protein [Granulicella sp. S190]